MKVQAKATALPTRSFSCAAAGTSSAAIATAVPRTARENRVMAFLLAAVEARPLAKSLQKSRIVAMCQVPPLALTGNGPPSRITESAAKPQDAVSCTSSTRISIGGRARSSTSSASAQISPRRGSTSKAGYDYMRRNESGQHLNSWAEWFDLDKQFEYMDSPRPPRRRGVLDRAVLGRRSPTCRWRRGATTPSCGTRRWPARRRNIPAGCGPARRCRCRTPAWRSRWWTTRSTGSV